ncbi:Eco47II family restriction endonuclease [Pseudoalteromonas sp. SG44-5]|uniref:Eco47II family restriction endonuclease n=1 Tax=Pseudoalteromonas sp. SG44-5 TaxID=2760960 RepID=UPI0015FBECDB|nr:Eco47II family restriction endonuclease [Pseudoalteromonas sp. SG44-5]MBB1404922.1 Eco47II family restriction endonuclease [Pseudoalteromonas sp. SG44-5]
MQKYGLSFISDVDLFEHVKDTIGKYRFTINLKEFNKNLVDPIKLTFDAKVYNKTVEQIIESESLRQIDKSNTNHIGYFHQNIFKYFKGWHVPPKGFDAVHEGLKIFVEMKNKHNTMNSASSQKTYMKMQNKILRDDRATCYLVEIIAKNSQDIKWNISLDGEPVSNKNIRRTSIDKFYEIITGEPDSFKKLCEVIPKVIDDVMLEGKIKGHKNTVFDELKELSPNILKSIYLLSFEKYQGFSDLNIAENP